MEHLTNLLLGVVIIGYMCHYIYKKMNITTVTSTIDDRPYNVRELADKQVAADTLATISQKLTDLVEHVHKTSPDREGVTQ